MNETNRIEVELSKTKLIKLAVFSLLFFLAGLWMILTNPQTSNALFNSPLVKALASYGSALMGLVGLFFFSKRLFSKGPALILTEEGLYDYSSVYKIGFIPWTDIEGIYETAIQASLASKQYFVTIGMKDPDKYISREKNGLKRKLLVANLKRYGSPVHISTNDLKADHKELFSLINEYFVRYGAGV